MENALIGTGFANRDGADLDFFMATLKELAEKSGGVRRAGSAALDFAYVACGRLDGLWQNNLKTWDSAAGALLVREAGGLVNDFQGGDTWSESGNVIAASPKIQHAMLQMMGGILKEHT